MRARPLDRHNNRLKLVPSKSLCRSVLIALFASVLAAVTLMTQSIPLAAQTKGWSRPFKLSLNGGWFPDIAADATGRVHVVWSSDTLNYRTSDGRAWSSTNDIAIAANAAGLPINDVFRSAIAADRLGYLHLFYYHLTQGLGYYTSAPVDRAGESRAWIGSQVIGARGGGYYTAIAVDSLNRIHAIYIDKSFDSELSDIYYRRSDDSGLTWSPAVNLSNSPRTGSSRPQIMIDQFDTIHVSWDEGWDRRSGNGIAQTSKYVYSTDRGNSWSAMATFGSPKNPSAQLAVISDSNARGRIAIWRGTVDENIYYQGSADNGRTWTAPTPIPGVFARPWNSPLLDQYALARDDNGVVHLVAVIRRTSSATSQWVLTHLEWNGKNWSAPESVFDQPGLYPEYPRVAIALGNQLHVVWFTRVDAFSTATLDVWYSSKTLGVPLRTPMAGFPTVTSVATLVKPTSFATETLTPRPKPKITMSDDPLPTSSDWSTLSLVVGVGAAVVAVIAGIVLRTRH